METRKFNLKEDMPAFCRWHYLHNLPVPSPESIPAMGYIAYDGNVPLAAAFIRKVEGGFGQLDSLTGNPEISKELRNRGIDLVVSQVLSSAIDAGITKIMAYSTSGPTIERSKKFGFTQLPHTLIVLDLES